MFGATPPHGRQRVRKLRGLARHPGAAVDRARAGARDAVKISNPGYSRDDGIADDVRVCSDNRTVILQRPAVVHSLI